MSDKITLEFLKDLFQKWEPSVNLENFEETQASSRGDNYTALLYRIRLWGSIKKNVNDKETEISWEESIIYKCLPDSTVRREAFKSEALFHNEYIFYTRVVPLYEKFLDYVKYSPPKLTFIPKCYLAKEDLIILEDLCPKGFEMVDRKQGLNQKQILAVLKAIGFFHALSLSVKICWPGEFYNLFNKDAIKEGIFIHDNEEWYKEYYKRATTNAVNMVKEVLDNHLDKAKYIRKFEDFADDSFFSKMIKQISNTGPLSVLCHGDCWTNNILFKVSNENKIEVNLIDFQLCRHGSLALDLANLIYCCTSKKLRDSSLPLLLASYHESLSENLVIFLKNTDYKYHDLTNPDYLMELLKTEFKRSQLFGLGLAIDIIPISTCDSDQAPDMYEDIEDEVQHVPVETTNETCKIKMTNLVKELVDSGAL